MREDFDHELDILSARFFTRCRLMSQIQIRDEQGNGIPKIRVRFSVGPRSSDEAIYDNLTDASGNTGWPIPYWPMQPYTLWINTQEVNPIYESISVAVENGEDQRIVLKRVASPVIVRPSLPDLPVGAYDHELPWTPPESRDYLRADAWGVTILGLPFVKGGSSEHPERCLSWFLDRWSLDWQIAIVRIHRKLGYTHFILSAPDSMQGNGLSLDGFVNLCGRVKQVMPYTTVFLGSKLYQPRDMSVSQWISYVDPIMDALISAGVVDEFVPGWEWNLWNVPGDMTIEVFKHIGQKAHAAGASCWMHYSTHVTSWFADGSNRQDFYRALGSDVDGLMYQTDPNWSIPEMQARLVDTLKLNNTKLRLFEDSASLMFSHDRPNEDDANLRSYLGCCTVDNVNHTDAKMWGYGNGARRPDGSRL